ncbi:MAG: YeeE/YedE thiosulfate transporter family protein [Thermoleophilia bacterium]
MEGIERQNGQKRYIGWMYGGILLGLLNTFAVATYGALGVSRSYVVTDNIALDAAGSELPRTNSYLSLYPGTVDWLFMIAVGMVIGGFLAALIYRGFKPRLVPPLWAERFGDSRAKRFAAAFTGGFLLLLGARIAGGCTSGLVLSGVAQLSLAGLIFGISIFASGVVTAKLMYRRIS